MLFHRLQGRSLCRIRACILYDEDFLVVGVRIPYALGIPMFDMAPQIEVQQIPDPRL